MNLVRMTKKSEAYRAVKDLYLQAFPQDERAPFRLLVRRAKAGKADFWMLYEGETWVGLAYVLTNGQLAYLFYLAIAENERNRGYGKAAMRTLMTRYAGQKFFLALESLKETDAENYDQRIGRHAFYQSCGLVDLPYQIKEVSVIYDIMGTGEPVEPEEYRALIDAYLGRVFSKRLDMRILK